MDKKYEALKMVERATRVKVDNVRHRWPPICMGILHQPKRPNQKNIKVSK